MTQEKKPPESAPDTGEGRRAHTFFIPLCFCFLTLPPRHLFPSALLPNNTNRNPQQETRSQERFFYLPCFRKPEKVIFLEKKTRPFLSSQFAGRNSPTPPHPLLSSSFFLTHGLFCFQYLTTDFKFLLFLLLRPSTLNVTPNLFAAISIFLRSYCYCNSKWPCNDDALTPPPLSIPFLSFSFFSPPQLLGAPPPPLGASRPPNSSSKKPFSFLLPHPGPAS